MLYIAITLIAGVVVIQGIVSFARVLAQFKLTEDLNYTASTVLDTMVRDVRNAIAINSDASTFDDPSSVLVLTFLASDDTEYDRTYYLNSGVVYVQEGAGAPSALSRDSVSVDTFTVAHLENTMSEAAHISLELSATRGSITKQQSLRTAANVRNLYQ